MVIVWHICTVVQIYESLVEFLLVLSEVVFVKRLMQTHKLICVYFLIVTAASLFSVRPFPTP